MTEDQSDFRIIKVGHCVLFSMIGCISKERAMQLAVEHFLPPEDKVNRDLELFNEQRRKDGKGPASDNNPITLPQFMAVMKSIEDAK